MSVVIPDSIEPVVGWRTFEEHQGLLISPQQRMPWPPGRAARALCSNGGLIQRWVEATDQERMTMEEEAREEGLESQDDHFVSYLMPDGEIEQRPVFMPWGMHGRVPQVPHYPRPGYEWVLQVKRRGHAAPQEACNCGIHLARNLDLAMHYASSRRRMVVFGLVQGWGKVIPGSDGFRVEFAYPQALYAFAQPHEDMLAYGVSIVPVTECPEYLQHIGVTWQ